MYASEHNKLKATTWYTLAQRHTQTVNIKSNYKKGIVPCGDLHYVYVSSLASAADPRVSLSCHSRVTHHIILLSYNLLMLSYISVAVFLYLQKTFGWRAMHFSSCRLIEILAEFTLKTNHVKSIN